MFKHIQNNDQSRKIDSQIDARSIGQQKDGINIEMSIQRTQPNNFELTPIDRSSKTDQLTNQFDYEIENLFQRSTLNCRNGTSETFLADSETKRASLYKSEDESRLKSESMDNELEIERRSTGECITKVRISRSSDDQLDNSDQSIMPTSSRMKSRKERVLNETLANNQKANSCDRMNKIERFSIFQMSNKTNGTEKARSKKCCSIDEQANSGWQRGERNSKNEKSEELLNELAAFNGVEWRRGNISRLGEHVEQTCVDELRQLEEGGLKQIQADGERQEENLGSEVAWSRASVERTAGKLKATVSKAVQLKPSTAHFEHLVDDENTFYRPPIRELCISSNDHVDLVSFISSDNTSDISFDSHCDPFNSKKCDLFDFLDQCDCDLIRQTNEFVTIINLDFKSTCQHACPLSNSNLCDDKCDDQFNFESDDLSSTMYSISGVESNGLTNKKQTLVPNVSTNHPLLHHPIATNPVTSTSVVPVVVSSLVNPAILHQNVHFITESVQIYREPGVRIGMALNFNEGNTSYTNSDQTIERVFIQNVNPNSPASMAKGERLGALRENDELLCIENRPVNTMTRLDCVECLRDAGTCITLLVRGARVDCLTRTATTFEQPHTATLKRSLNNKLKSPPVIPPRSSQTILTSVQLNNKDTTTTYKNCDLNNSDKSNTNHHSKNSTTCPTGTLKIRRPVVAPPLPPRKLSSNSSLNEDTNKQTNEPTLSSNSIEQLNDQSDEMLVTNDTPSVPGDLKQSEFAKSVEESSIVVMNSLDERLDNQSIDCTGKEDTNSIKSAPTKLVNNEDKFKRATHDASSETLTDQCDQSDEQSPAIMISPNVYPTSSGSSVSYAANIATSSLQLMNGLNCINSQSSISNQLDSISQQHQNNFESESDTESSLSTVIERFSRTCSANSSFSEKNCLIGHRLLGNDQNRNLQLANIEKVLTSFEFLEREFDRGDSNASTTMRAKKNSFDNLVTTSTNLTMTNGETKNTTIQTVNESTGRHETQLDHLTSNRSVATNYMQCDLTLTSSSEQTPSSDRFEVNLDDYDDIQTIAVDCNVTEYSDNSLAKAETGINNLTDDSTSTKLEESVVLSETTSLSVKDNRFVREDCKNKKNKIKSAVHPTSATSDLIRKENKELKDDSKIIVLSTNLVDNDVKSGDCKSTNVIQRTCRTGSLTTGEERTVSNLITGDHLIGEQQTNLKAKTDSGNNNDSNLEGHNCTEEVLARDESSLLGGSEKARIEILNTKAKRGELSRIQQLDESNQQIANQTNSYNLEKRPTDQSTELELNDEQMITNQSTVTSSKSSDRLESRAERSDLKVEKKTNQSKTSSKKSTVSLSNQANHANKTVRRTLSINSGQMNSNQTTSNSNSMPSSSITRPKIIELTKSTDLKKSTMRTIKRTPSDHQSNAVSNSTNANKKIPAKSNNVINSQTGNKNINQIKNKTMTSTVNTLKRNSPANAINKSNQLKVNSVKTNLKQSNNKTKSTNKESDDTTKKVNPKNKSNISSATTALSVNSSTHPSSISLAPVINTISRSSSQLSIATNQTTKVSRSASLLALHHAANPKKGQPTNQIPRSKSIYSLSSMIPKVMSREEEFVAQRDVGQSIDRRNKSAKSTNEGELNNKSNVRMMTDSETNSQFIQVTDQTDELTSTHIGEQRSADNESIGLSPNVNKMTSTTNIDESHAIDLSNEVQQFQLLKTDDLDERHSFSNDEHTIQQIIDNASDVCSNNESAIIGNDSVNQTINGQIDANSSFAIINQLDNESNGLNKSENDFREENSNCKNGTSKQVCADEGGATMRKTNEGGVRDAGAQESNAQAHETQQIRKLIQFKSDDQQVKQQINELIECVKKSEFLLSQTIDCEPLTIEIFDGIECSKQFDYDLQQCDNQTDRFNNNETLLIDTPSKESSNMIHSNVVNSSANQFSKIVNNKILNSSKSSDLGGSSEATSSSDESSKSAHELDPVERVNGLTRKDSVSSSSSSICSSSGSSSGVSSSHSGQFNSLNKNKITNSSPTNDLLLKTATATNVDSQSWIKNAKQPSNLPQHTKYSPCFKRIEHSLKSSLDDKSSVSGHTDPFSVHQNNVRNDCKQEINGEQLIITKVTVDAGSTILNDDLRKLKDKKVSNYVYSPAEYSNSKKHSSDKSEELSIAPDFAVESTDKLFNFCEFRAKDFQSFQLSRLAPSSSSSSTTSPCSPLSSSTFSTSSNQAANQQTDLTACTQATSLVKQRQKHLEQLAAAHRAQQHLNAGRVRSLSSRELSVNTSSSMSCNSTSGDEEASSSKQNFRAIVEQWKKRASNTDLNQLICSINSLATRTSKTTSKSNKDTWQSSSVKEGIYSSETELNQPIVSSNVAAVIHNFNQNATTNLPPPLPPKPKRTMCNGIGMVSNSFMQGASASTTALNSMNHQNQLNNNNYKSSKSKQLNGHKETCLTNGATTPINKTNNDLPDDFYLSKTTRSMSVSDICKVFEKQQNVTSSTTSTSSSTNSQANSSTPTSAFERIKINKNLEMRKRELFGKELNGSNTMETNIEPKTKIKKFTSASMIKSTVQSLNLAGQFKAKSTNSLMNNISESSMNGSNLIRPTSGAEVPVNENFINQTSVTQHSPLTTPSPIKEVFESAQAAATVDNSKAPIISNNQATGVFKQASSLNSSISSASLKDTSDDADSVFSNSPATNRLETIINASISREIEPTTLNRNTAKYTAEVLNELIENASKSIEEELSSHNIKHTIEVIILQRESARTGSIGITLAGGADYENKEITVHKIINGSLAQRDGRIEKGDRILSINGILLKNKTHKEALDIMKTPTPEIILVVFHNLSDSNASLATDKYLNKKSGLSNYSKLSKELSYSSRELSSVQSTSSLVSLSASSSTLNQVDNFKIYKANLMKDGASLGFVLEGGRDSPLGDKPLIIKRIFRGGPADQEGTLLPGDELICVNNVAVYNMTRTEAWNHLKKQPDGSVSMVVRRKLYSY